MRVSKTKAKENVKNVVTTYVRNNSLTKKMFDALCDFLNSRHHRWHLDYRWVEDFDESKTKLFWQSYTVCVGDFEYWNALFNAVREEVLMFCEENGLPFDSVEVVAEKHAGKETDYE